jgi:long-chain fatty acid transport protein
MTTRSGALAVLLMALAPSLSSAQALFEQFNFQFAFSTPGARSKGMGQAFTALADDASAAESNPGGLAFRQATSEVMLEVSTLRNITERAAREDDFATGSSARFGDRVTAPSFLGWVLRTRGLAAKGLNLTFFYHRFLSYEESFHLDRRAVPGTQVFFLPTDGDTDLSGESFGLGVGWRLGAKLGLGVSGKVERMHVRTHTTRSDIFDPNVVVNVQEIDDQDVAPGFTLGGVWAPFRDHPELRAGISYSYNPAFHLREEFDDVADGVRTPVAGYPRTLKASVPDRVSVGLARAGARLATAIDVGYERYSELAAGSTLLPQVGEIPRDAFRVRDVWSVHAGLEWKVLAAGRTYLRAGVFTAPTHSFRYTGARDTPAGLALFYAFDSKPESTTVAWSVGAGQHFFKDGASKFKATLAFTSIPGQSNEALISLSLLH